MRASKAYSYIRFSSDVQQWGDSERRQEQKSKDWCARKEIQLADVYADRGVSGRAGANRQNGAFAALLNVAKAGDFILIEDNDRFSREDALTAMLALKDVCQKGITVVFLKTGIEVNKTNFNDPAVLLTNFLQAYVGNAENEKKSQRLQEAWKAKKKAAANKVPVTSLAPAWVDVDMEAKTITKNKRAAIVQRMYEAIAAGKGIRAICAELNADGIPPFGRGRQNRGNGWSSTHVKRILTSRSVIGEYQPTKYMGKGKPRIKDGEPIPDYYPRIISNELFYKVQEIVGRNVAKGGPKVNATNLFTGFCKCSECGGPLHVKHTPMNQGQHHYVNLFCAKAKRNAGCKHRGTIQLRHVERAVLSLLWSKVIPHLSEENTRQEQLTAAKGQLQDVEKSIARLTNAIAETDVAPQSVILKIREQEARKAVLAGEVERLEALATDSPLLNWQQCEPTIENRQRLQNILRGEVESLVIDIRAKRATITLKDPAVSFVFQWNYQRANQVRVNPADNGFILSGPGLAPKHTPYLDEVFVWKTKNSPSIANVLRLEGTLADGRETTVGGMLKMSA